MKFASWINRLYGMGFLFNRKKSSFLSNGKYAHILSTGACIYFLENFGNFWKTQGNLREFFSTALVDTMMLLMVLRWPVGEYSQELKP